MPRSNTSSGRSYREMVKKNGASLTNSSGISKKKACIHYCYGWLHRQMFWAVFGIFFLPYRVHPKDLE